MATPNEKLAESLDALKALQEGGRRVFRSDELSRVHRERLLTNGFLQEVMKGWLISASPSARAGDSTPWYASFWEFCGMYCSERFGERLAPVSRAVAVSPCGEHSHPDAGRRLQPEGRQQHGEASVRVVDLRPEGDGDANAGRPELAGRLAPVLSRGLAGEGHRGLVFAQSYRDASGARGCQRLVGRAPPPAERRPFSESGLPCRSVPPHRTAGDCRRDRQDDEERGLRRAGKRSLRVGADVRGVAAGGSAHCRSPASHVAVDARKRHRDFPESAGAAEGQGCVFALHRRNLSA